MATKNTQEIMTKHLMSINWRIAIAFLVYFRLFQEKKTRQTKYEFQTKNKWGSAHVNKTNRNRSTECNVMPWIWTYVQHTYGFLGILALCFVLFSVSRLLYCHGPISMASRLLQAHLDNYIIAVTIQKCMCVYCVCNGTKCSNLKAFERYIFFSLSVALNRTTVHNKHSTLKFVSLLQIDIELININAIAIEISFY